MTELQTLQHDPNDALLELGPADDDVMQWRAVMKGVEGTAYEGIYKSAAYFTHTAPTLYTTTFQPRSLTNTLQMDAGSSPSQSPRSTPSPHLPSAS
jgi:hypothetical protein